MYGNLLCKGPCLVIGGSSRTRADVLSFDLDDWLAEAVESRL